MLEAHMGRRREECRNPRRKYFDEGDDYLHTRRQTVAVVLASRRGVLDGWSYLSMVMGARR